MWRILKKYDDTASYHIKIEVSEVLLANVKLTRICVLDDVGSIMKNIKLISWNFFISPHVCAHVCINVGYLHLGYLV